MKSQGFTLIELLLVIAIIGILAALGIMNYARWRASSAVMEGAVQFAQAINATRTGAKKANACWQIRLTGTATNVTQYQVNRFTTSSCTGTPDTSSTYTLPSQTRISLTSGAASNNVNFVPPYATTDASPNSYSVTWAANPSISRTVRITSILGKVVVK
ncbi:type II secretion system protein [Deinococcus sp. MIMF12]|uniref:Type II secretion system protein n=1 Tax=Deinococcus rhizophilus TaxID=3049544 RepID=A0ABT7JG51_9DEIO|nr:type II secretion system protein [Deinococcus rhizophilus]MDL2344037.1 type II secretion system protein [Deinococcus rhizophilus]